MKTFFGALLLLGLFFSTGCQTINYVLGLDYVSKNELTCYNLKSLPSFGPLPVLDDTYPNMGCVKVVPVKAGVGLVQDKIGLLLQHGGRYARDEVEIEVVVVHKDPHAMLCLKREGADNKLTVFGFSSIPQKGRVIRLPQGDVRYIEVYVYSHDLMNEIRFQKISTEMIHRSVWLPTSGGQWMEIHPRLFENNIWLPCRESASIHDMR